MDIREHVVMDFGEWYIDNSLQDIQDILRMNHKTDECDLVSFYDMGTVICAACGSYTDDPKIIGAFQLFDCYNGAKTLSSVRQWHHSR